MLITTVRKPVTESVATDPVLLELRRQLHKPVSMCVIEEVIRKSFEDSTPSTQSVDRTVRLRNIPLQAQTL